MELREGYTTGTCAAAAAAAGLHSLLTGERPGAWDTPLPGRGRLMVPVAGYAPESGGGMRVSVQKDGGDDPDATHGTLIQAVVMMDPPSGDEGIRVEVDGGRGVGRVTLPGLPVPVGRAAINPAPLAQIEDAVREVAHRRGFTGTVRVVVEAPEGERLAEKTMNPRLGIVGGISILGTGGIVRPYSHESWRASILQGMDVARAAGLSRLVLTTGRRTERFYLERFPDAAPLSVVQVADFFAFSMEEAARRDFTEVVWSVFFGKLVKQAMGFPSTHAKDSRMDFGQLAGWSRECLADEETAGRVERANTALEVAAAMAGTQPFGRLLALLISRAVDNARSLALGQDGPDWVRELKIGYAVFDFDARLLMFREPAQQGVEKRQSAASAKKSRPLMYA